MRERNVDSFQYHKSELKLLEKASSPFCYCFICWRVFLVLLFQLYASKQNVGVECRQSFKLRYEAIAQERL